MSLQICLSQQSGDVCACIRMCTDLYVRLKGSLSLWLYAPIKVLPHLPLWGNMRGFNLLERQFPLLWDRTFGLIPTSQTVIRISNLIFCRLNSPTLGVNFSLIPWFDPSFAHIGEVGQNCDRCIIHEYIYTSKASPMNILVVNNRRHQVALKQSCGQLHQLWLAVLSYIVKC